METPCNGILIVEDDENIRDALKVILEYEGFLVTEAGNGKEALELLHRAPRPCLILSDLMMPVMDGWEFSNALAADLNLAMIPVVVVSAFSDRTRGLKCREVVSKPVDIELLISLARRYCSEAEQKRWRN